MGRRSVRSTEEWTKARGELRAMLRDAAVRRSTVTYSEVAFRCFGGRVPARSRLIMDLLAEVDSEEAADTGLVIASLVVRADSGVPGAGYFSFLALELGRDVSDPHAAWRAEAERVWAAFAESNR